MNDLCALLTELESALPAGAHDSASGVALGITEVALDLPVESRIEEAGLWLCLPRGRLATGFTAPHGRLTVTFEREVR